MANDPTRQAGTTLAPYYFITGTDTDAGKTIAASQLIRGLNHNGIPTVGMKPAASGCIVQEDILLNADVEAHRQASPIVVPEHLLNPYRFLPPISPHLAAREAGVTIELDHILDCATALRQYASTIVIEGAGGWYAPLSDTLRIADLAIALQAPVILVVGMRLGCINHALLTAEAILQARLPLAGWIANCIDPEMSRFAENLAYLQTHIPAPCLAVIEHNADAALGCLNPQAFALLKLQNL